MAATRFDSLIEEETKKENMFSKSNKALKGKMVGEEPVQEAKEDDIKNVEEPEVTSEENRSFDILSLIGAPNKNKNKKKQTSFTLKEKNYNKLQKLAKERDISISSILDKILDEILWKEV